MIFKKLFIYTLSIVLMANPLGEAFAQSNRNTRLAKMELNAALQRLEINNKNLTIGKLWKKNRPSAEPEARKFMDRLIGLNPNKKIPKYILTDISDENRTAFRISIQEGAQSLNVEMIQTDDENYKIKIGNSLFTPDEFSEPQKWIKRYYDENPKAFFSQHINEVPKSKNSFVLTQKELNRLTGKQRAMYFINLRYLLVSAHEVQLLHVDKSKDTAYNNESSPYSTFFDWLSAFAESAHANSPLSCVVAGWGSQYLPRGQTRGSGVTCPFPGAGEEARQKCSSPQTQTACNPSIFGLSNKSTGTPHCIPFTHGRVSRDSQRATLACHQTSNLDGSTQKTIELLSSMQAGNPDWFSNGAVKPEHMQAARSLAETIQADTNRAIDQCISSRQGSETVSNQPQQDIAADKYNTSENYDNELNDDRTEAKQRLACHVLMSRRTALQRTIDEWRVVTPPEDGCTQRPGGAITVQPLPAPDSQTPSAGATTVIEPRPVTPQNCNPPPTPAPVTQDRDWWKVPALILGGAAILLGACLLFKVGPCKKKKATAIPDPQPQPDPQPDPIPDPKPNPDPIPDPQPQPLPIEGGERVAPIGAGGVRQPGTGSTTSPTAPVRDPQPAGGIR